MIVIPTFNEGERLISTLTDLDKALAETANWEFEIVLVDDASARPFSLRDLNFRLPIYLLRHNTNLGQGAALETAFTYCRRTLAPDYVVTIDADGQHSSQDIIKFLNHLITSDLDILFGNRFTKDLEMPRLRFFVLMFARVFEKFITGLNLSDAHNGFRVFNRKALEALVLNQNRMAHATEVKQIVARSGLRCGELHSRISYSSETLAKGQSNIGALIILRDLLKSYLFDR